MKIKKFQLILGAVALVLAVSIAFTAVEMVNRYNDVIKKKKVIQHTKLEYVDKDLNDYIDDVIDDTNDIIDNGDVAGDPDDNANDDIIIPDDIDGDDQDNSNPSDNSSTPSKGDSDNDDDDDNGDDDDDDWTDDEEDNKTYTSPIQMTGSKVTQSGVRNIGITTKKTVFSDYYGLGGSLFPEILSDIPTSGWYNSVAWEFERQKAINNKPNMSRLLIDMDAIITDTEPNPQREDYVNNSDYINYMTGVYDFTNDSASSFFETLDCLNQAGTEVIFNTGWKCDNRIKTWYPDNAGDWANSAPYNINAFVRANIAWLLEIQSRGYKVRYVDFGNEVTWGGDFKTHQDAIAYHTVLVSAMVRALEYAKENEVTYKYIDKEGVTRTNTAKLNMNVEMLLADGACTVNDGAYPFFCNLRDSLKKVLGDATPKEASVHIYYNSNINMEYTNLYNTLNKYRQNACDVFVTEMFVSPAACDADYNKLNSEHKNVTPGVWDTSLASYFIAAANTGARGINNWEYGSSFYPCISTVKGSNFVDGAGAIFGGANKASEYRVATNYRLSSLLSNYVPAHSDVLMSKWEGDDMRVAAFKLPDGNYTFVVEAKASSAQRTVKIALDQSVGKLYRYHFNETISNGVIKDSENRSLQGTMIQSDKTFNSASLINDTIDSDYGVYVYSTKAPVAQIKLNTAVTEIEKSASLTINADLLNCNNLSNIKWEISAATKQSGTSLSDKDLMNDTGRKGSITVNGNECTYTPGRSAESGDAVAIRATLLDENGNETNTYSVSVVYIK